MGKRQIDVRLLRSGLESICERAQETGRLDLAVEFGFCGGFAIAEELEFLHWVAGDHCVAVEDFGSVTHITPANELWAGKRASGEVHEHFIIDSVASATRPFAITLFVRKGDWETIIERTQLAA